MKNKFVFINFVINPGYSSLVNCGIAFLVPILKRYSYHVEVISLTKELSDEELTNKIKEINPSIIGFSCTTNQFKHLIRYSRALENLGILQIAGGKHPTLNPEVTLLRSSVKGVCIGEGELPLEDLLKNIKHKEDILKTKGFYWNVNGEIKKNPVPQFIKDLSTIDFPDYSVFESVGLLDECIPNGMHLIFSRGCPFQCTYCCNKALSEVYPSNKNFFRIPSVEYCIEFLEELIKKYPEIKFIDFVDDNFIAKKKWVENFAEEYKKKIGLPYHILARFENIESDILISLKSSGCRLIYCGLESGSEFLRYNILNRKHSNKLIIEKSKMIKEAGIKLFVFSIFGFPFETKQQMKETLNLNKKIKPDQGLSSFFYPYKGTDLYDLCRKNNLLKNEEEMLSMTNYNERVSIKMSKTMEKNCLKFKKKLDNYYLKRSASFTYYYLLRPIFIFSTFLRKLIRTFFIDAIF